MALSLESDCVVFCAVSGNECSASLEPPLPLCPALRPRAGPPRQTNCGASVLPSLFLARRLPHCFTFEAQSHGFTARCLRLKAPFLDTNQGSLPVDGQSLSGGVVPPGLGRGFRLLATSFSPFGSLFGFTSALPASQGFGWRQGTLKSGGGFMGWAEAGEGSCLLNTLEARAGSRKCRALEPSPSSPNE